MARTRKSDEEFGGDFRCQNSITKLPIDYPSEGLNDIARKINEIIDHLHG